ncbi:MAG: MFS transporter [Actinobacteria bacterium]|nr:MFS transporter [Actinomycetota bacterium]
MNETRRRWLLGGMCAVLACVLLDETIVAVALPEMASDLGATSGDIRWVISAYLLALASTVAAAGRLADVVGLRRAIVVGAVIFGAASVLAGAAPSSWWLILARVVQGLGAAMLLPASYAMITSTNPPDRRGRALGYYSLAGSVALAVGPLAGGALVSLFNWRPIFFVNLPIVLFILIVTWKTAPRRGVSGSDRHIDVAGLLLLVVGLVSLVLAIMQAPAWGWLQPVTLLLAAAGVVLLVGFSVWQLRASSPLLELDLFAQPTFVMGNLMVFFTQFSKSAVIIFGAFYLQDVLGMTALEAGLALLPAVVLMPLLSVPSGNITDHLGPRRPGLGALLVMTLALVWFTAIVNVDNYWLLVPGLVVWGASVPFLFVTAISAVMSAAPTAKGGQAGGINVTGQWLGAIFSVAILGSLVVYGEQRYGLMYLVAAGLMGFMTLLAFIWFARKR